jgi:FtsH-binding integral membrane protein
MISIWFFIGLLLLAYGVIITGSGVVDWNTPSDVIHAELHAPVWWGALLVVIGAFYTIRFKPRKGN